MIYRWQLESPENEVEAKMLNELQFLRSLELNAAHCYPDEQPKWELQEIRFGWNRKGKTARQRYNELMQQKRIDAKPFHIGSRVWFHYGNGWYQGRVTAFLNGKYLVESFSYMGYKECSASELHEFPI